jgi:hypothetical protein
MPLLTVLLLLRCCTCCCPRCNSASANCYKALLRTTVSRKACMSPVLPLPAVCSATEDDLVEFFSQCGTVVDLVRRANKEGKLNTFCHVQFDTTAAMERACQLTGSRKRPAASRGAALCPLCLAALWLEMLGAVPFWSFLACLLPCMA